MSEQRNLLSTEARARVFIGPEPVGGPHPGYRGTIRVDAIGVHLNVANDCEFLCVFDYDPNASPDWPLSSWEPVEKRQIIPWHKVDAIEWEDEED